MDLFNKDITFEERYDKLVREQKGVEGLIKRLQSEPTTGIMGD